MKSTLFLIISIFCCLNLFGQMDLKPIEIKKSKFYQEGSRLKPGKPLELALQKANNNEVNALFNKGKSLSTIGIVTQCLGLGIMLAGLVKSSSGNSGVSYTIGGASVFLVGSVISIPAMGNKKKAVVKYNEFIAKM